MTKLFAIMLSAVVFLTACGKHESPIEFKGPSGPPDFEKIKPTSGPNDPVPHDGSIGQPVPEAFQE